MASGMTLIEVTHSMDDAARADDLIVLDRSHLMFQGTPQEVFCRENREALEGAGLGLPSALTLALRLEDEGGRPLGDPLTLDALKCALGTGLHREVV
jgi:energy-coupling factor transport system ATP-binding protein